MDTYLNNLSESERTCKNCELREELRCRTICTVGLDLNTPGRERLRASYPCLWRESGESVRARAEKHLQECVSELREQLAGMVWHFDGVRGLSSHSHICIQNSKKLLSRWPQTVTPEKGGAR